MKPVLIRTSARCLGIPPGHAGLAPNGARLRKPGVIFRHGGACPRRAMFATRTPPNDVAPPPRSSPS
jgi:hypothetical protein